MPRTECLTLFKSADDKVEARFIGIVKNSDMMRDDIAALRESRSALQGREASQDKSQLQNHWIVGIIVSLVISSAALAGTLYSIADGGKIIP